MDCPIQPHPSSSPGYYLYRSGQYQEAELHLREALQWIVSLEPPERLALNHCSTLRTLAEIALNLDRAEEARDLADSYCAIARRIHHRYSLYRGEMIDVDLLRRDGQYAAASQRLSGIETQYKPLLTLQRIPSL